MGGHNVQHGPAHGAAPFGHLRHGGEAFTACLGARKPRLGWAAWWSGMGGRRREKAKHGRGLSPPAVSEAGLDPGYWLSASTALAGPRLSWPPVVDSTSAM